MQNETYRQHVIAAIENLVSVRTSLFDSLVPIAMQGELKAWNDSVPIGEEHFLSRELFEACEDANLQLLLSVMRKIEETIETMANLNGLEIE